MGATGGVMHRRLDGGSDGGESPAVGGGDEEGRENGRGQIPVLGIAFDVVFGWGSGDLLLLPDGGSPRDQRERGEDDWQTTHFIKMNKCLRSSVVGLHFIRWFQIWKFEPCWIRCLPPKKQVEKDGKTFNLE